MNRTELAKQQSELRAAMQVANTEGDATKFNELLKKHQAIDVEIKKLVDADERAAALKELEARESAPQGRTTVPAGAPSVNRDEVRASKEYEDNFRTWIRQAREGVSTRALGLYSDVDGGYTLAPSRLEGEIIKPVKNLSVVQDLSKYEMIEGVLSSTGLNLSSVTANSQKGVTVDLTTESTTGESVQFSKRRMMSHPFTHWMKVPNALIAFSGIDILAFIMQEIRERKAVADDYRYIYGTGIEEPLGLAVADPHGIATGRNFTATTAGIYTYLLLEAAYFNQKPQHRAESTWLVDTTGHKQIMGLVDTQGRPLLGLGINTGSVPSLFGKPLVESNNLAPALTGSVFTAGQIVGIFGNFKRYAIMESKNVGVKLDPYRLSDEDVTVVYVRSWIDGMPQLSEAFTRLVAA